MRDIKRLKHRGGGYGSSQYVLVPEYIHIRVVNGKCPFHTPSEDYGEYRMDIFSWRGHVKGRWDVRFFKNIDETRRFVGELKRKHGSAKSRFTIITQDDFQLLPPNNVIKRG